MQQGARLVWFVRKRKGSGKDSGSDFARMISLPALRLAWRQVRANGGAAGGDGQSLADFADNLEEELRRLHEELRTGRYRCGPLRKARLRKSDGGWRELRIPGVRDRVIQTACQQHLARMLDAHMHPRSFAYRPRRSVDMALAHLRRDLEEGFCWVVDADIEKFFDRVDHRLLLAQLRKWGVEGEVMALLRMWLRGFSAGGRGIAQGAPISPLLANLFLHPLDVALHGRERRLVRYADDFVLACPTRAGAQEALREARRQLAALKLRLHPEKTRIVAAWQGFVFLGSRIVMRAHITRDAAT